MCLLVVEVEEVVEQVDDLLGGHVSDVVVGVVFEFVFSD